MADLSSTPAKEQTGAGRAEQTRGGVTFVPRVDIYETEQELLLLADLPGVRPEDVDLRYEQGELHLSGRVQPRGRGQQFLVSEYGLGDFYRTFVIHETIDSTRISAECKNGVLTVHLPKAAAARPRKIEVRSQ